MRSARIVLLMILGIISWVAAEDIRAEEHSSVNAEEFVGGERVTRAPASAARNGVSRKRYPGGGDEDDLQVQATLPIPSRTFDGVMTTTSAASESPSETATPPPAND